MTTSKRSEIRDRRLKKKRQQRLITILMILGAAIILMALFITPNVIAALQPVGEITPITPVERPMVDGRTMGDPNAPVYSCYSRCLADLAGRSGTSRALRLFELRLLEGLGYGIGLERDVGG